MLEQGLQFSKKFELKNRWLLNTNENYIEVVDNEGNYELYIVSAMFWMLNLGEL